LGLLLAGFDLAGAFLFQPPPWSVNVAPLSRPKTLSPAWIKSLFKLPSFWRRLAKAVGRGQQFELTCWNPMTGATELHFIEPILVMTISGERVLGALAFNREDQSETLKVFFPHKMQRIKQTEMDLDWMKARHAAEKRNLLRAIRRGPIPACLLEPLPARSRELIQLKCNERLSHKEISARTGLNIGTVGCILHYAVKAIAEKAGH